jgi:GDP-4-dehydro-6-deoxy-D-mannose reductase
MAPNRLLITGGSSFSAGHAARFLSQNSEFSVFGTSRRPSSLDVWEDYYLGDITDSDFVTDIVQKVNPTHVLHLSGSTNPGQTNELIQVNLTGTWYLLSACSKLRSGIRILLVGSAAGFGEMTPGETALSPQRPGKPSSLYGWIREKTFELTDLLEGGDDFAVKKCRTFNLLGPGLPDKYAPTAFIQRMLNRNRTDESPFLVKDGNCIRDFIDIRDACRAWINILQDGHPKTIYSVGRGVPVTILELCELIRDRLELSFEINCQASSHTHSRSRIHRSVADIKQLQQEINWNCRIGLEQSVDDMLEHARKPLN